MDYFGIDLHQKHSEICGMDGEGRKSGSRSATACQRAAKRLCCFSTRVCSCALRAESATREMRRKAVAARNRAVRGMADLFQDDIRSRSQHGIEGSPYLYSATGGE